MDPLYMANSLLRRRRFEECVKVCTEILESNPYDQVSGVPVQTGRCIPAAIGIETQPSALPLTPLSVHPSLPLHSTRTSLSLSLQAAWFLKVRALTEQTYVDEVEMEEEGIAEVFLDDTAIADVASGSLPVYTHTHTLTHTHTHTHTHTLPCVFISVYSATGTYSSPPLRARHISEGAAQHS